MMKKLMAVLMALLLMLSSVCVAEEADAVLATAYNGEISVLASEVKAEFDEMVEAYVAYYTQYGYTVDPYDVEFQNSVAQETVQLKLSERVAERHAMDTGYELTQEMDEMYQAEALAALAEMMEYYTQYLANYGVPEEQIEEVAKAELEAAGYTYDELYRSAKLKGVLDHLYALGTEGVEATEEEVKAAFEAKVAEQKAAYDEDVDAFISAYISEEELLYTPDGVRLMHCLFTALEEEGAEAVETDDPAQMVGLARAEALLAKIRAGEDFTIVMEAYNEDASTPEQMQRGYPVSADSGSYGDEFKNGAMALAAIGDVSDVIVTDYGYFILKYAADMTAGAAEFEPRKEAETEEALTNKRNEAYSAYINNMIDGAGCVINDMSPLFNIYVAENVEATVAYATVSAETDLTDMPVGAAVAKLSAGASVDVLGRIAVDGGDYVFAAVPGTAFKGYVAASALTDCDEATALAADNAALAAACEAEAKNPTFTIVMNDGSAIYGELYPEVAPESVGNFVELANSNFYDGLTFHRVIPGFMIQGGDPNGDGTGGPGYAITGEFSANDVDNDISHVRGVLSMARSTPMDSAGSQFFIMHADSDYLDGNYAAFGMVLGGMDAVDLIASQPTDANDKPMSAQTMRTIYVETYGQTYAFTKLAD